MKKESMEEGLIKKPVTNNEIKINGKDDTVGSSVTPLLLFSTVLSGFVALSNGCAAGYTSAAEAGIMEDLSLSIAQFSLFGSILNFGSMFGAIASGKLADLMGRKPTMLLMDILVIIGWSAIIFAQGALWLQLGRLSIGFGFGILTYLLPVYVAEITPKNIRGGFSGGVMFMINVGVSVMFFAGNIIAWRSLAVIGVLPALIHVLGLFFVPESPRWLANNGREKQFEDTLQRLRGPNVDITGEATEIRDSIATLRQLSEPRFMEMFEKKYARSLIVVIGTLILLPLGGSLGLLFYASSIFRTAGASVTLGTTAYAIIQIPVGALGVLSLDRTGRRPLLLVSFIGACLGSVLAGVAFVLQDLNLWEELSGTLVLIGVLVNLLSFSLAVSVPWVIMAEMLPINIKGPAGSLGTFSKMFVAWIVNYIFNFLLEWSPSGMFFIFASFSGLTILFVAKMVPETKGRTLEEIEASMLDKSV
ncbi:sugar transporter ERD6-like 10 isoform X1 [Daucus carota subsp. sativus]|nr:PREDICTED: sugar transporter ERD6-like 10 [Daucus carota subsp. sativus]